MIVNVLAAASTPVLKRIRSGARLASSTAMGANEERPLLRTNISIVGAMNVGKSTLMNVITQQATSIVDPTPGTTADTKIALMEMHSLGPVKLMDTPGIDESGELGRKKRERSFASVRESDACVIVADPTSEESIATAAEALSYAARNAPTATPLLLFNVRRDRPAAQGGPTSIEAARARLGVDQSRTLAIDLVENPGKLRAITDWIEANIGRHTSEAPLMPPKAGLRSREAMVMMNIPMDEETPSGRLLRPQSMMQEALLRNYVDTFAYRMDLRAARGKDGPEARAAEERRFRETVDTLRARGKLKLLVTDSQAIDVVDPWTLEKGSRETVPITTFSVAMVNYLSAGGLSRFVDGLRTFEDLRRGDGVLICEACNHNRIVDDIGVSQIPKKIEQRFGRGVVRVDHSFGRQYADGRDLAAKYRLIIHCGGCMLDQQKMRSRLDELEKSRVPITNYGLLLSLMQSRSALQRVLRPFGISF